MDADEGASMVAVAVDESIVDESEETIGEGVGSGILGGIRDGGGLERIHLPVDPGLVLVANWQ